MPDLAYSEAERRVGRIVLAWLAERRNDYGTERLDQLDRGDILSLSVEIVADLFGAIIVPDPGLSPETLTQHSGALSDWPDPAPTPKEVPV